MGCEHCLGEGQGAKSMELCAQGRSGVLPSLEEGTVGEDLETVGGSSAKRRRSVVRERRQVPRPEDV